jgi:hypothetical protein
MNSCECGGLVGSAGGGAGGGEVTAAYGQLSVRTRVATYRTYVGSHVLVVLLAPTLLSLESSVPYRYAAQLFGFEGRPSAWLAVALRNLSASKKDNSPTPWELLGSGGRGNTTINQKPDPKALGWVCIRCS